jgi:urease accessory protein
MEITTIITDDAVQELSLLRLLQLSSASLPVGGYAFSQGLEYAIDNGWVTNAAQVADWLSLVMHESIAKVDLPLLQRQIKALQNNSEKDFTYWNAYSLACRETMELRLTEVAMGDALARLLNSLEIPMPDIGKGQHEKNSVEKNTDKKTASGTRKQKDDISFVSAFAVAAVHWKVAPAAINVGYLWSWLENQIAAATKIVPLGQTSAQRLLVSLGEQVAVVIQQSHSISDDHIGSSLPGLAMASSWHETQYSRLFRS